jgi:hypothetical protein
MRHALIPHPGSRATSAAGVDAEALRPRPGALVLRYRVLGETGDLRLPAPRPPKRTDGLWRSTCFEAFVRAEGEDAYIEINLAPSTEWAVYRFSDYRTGMTAAKEVSAPRIATRRDAYGYHLEAEVDLGWAPHLPPDAPWSLALTAVLEDNSGGLSYWALTHPQGQPDFHAAAGLALRLPRSGA